MVEIRKTRREVIAWRNNLVPISWSNGNSNVGQCALYVLDPHGVCTTYNHRFNFNVKHNGKGIHDSQKEGEPSHWQLFHFHYTCRFWNDNLQVDHTWSFTIPSHMRQSTIWSTSLKKLFVELEVPTIGPHALDEIANWYEFHFQAFEWGTYLPLKQWFLKWQSIAFNSEFWTLKMKHSMNFPCTKSSKTKSLKIIPKIEKKL